MLTAARESIPRGVAEGASERVDSFNERIRSGISQAKRTERPGFLWKALVAAQPPPKVQAVAGQIAPLVVNLSGT